jgi:predicted enzyme related to lactoylglutathione lyase
VTEPTAAQPGEPCWIDLLTSDTDVATRFYGGLFGWTAESAGPEYGGYVNFSNGDTRVAGMMGITPEMGPMPDAWSTYLASTDTRATLEAATANGGGVMMQATDIPLVGVMGYATDPGGAAIGVFQATGEMAFGYDLQTVGAPGWFELHTKDYDATIEWLRRTFGWKTHVMSDTPEFRYTNLGSGDDQKAGVMDAAGFLPPDVPSHWSIYFRVADIDASVATAMELGGTVVAAPEDTPYGKLATLTDPNGAMFKLVQGA